MTTLFISDLHLSENDPKITALFLDFMCTQASHAEALYILGDFFAAWIGDDDNTLLHDTIKASLKNLTDKKIPIYIMRGNRDFLLGDRFMQETGCQLLADDEAVINLYGQKTVLMHGDTLCTQDVDYQRYRKIVQHQWFRGLCRIAPLPLRRWVSKKMREKSRQAISQKEAYIMDVVQTDVDRVLKKHGVFHLIHGHTHRPQIHHFQIGEKTATRTVLGAWHDTGSVLVCNTQGCELRTL